MASEKIHLNFLPNSYWEISAPVFFSKTFNCNFVCMGNKFVADSESLHKDLYPSRYDHIKYLAAFLNDPTIQSLSDSDYTLLKSQKFELFLRSIDGFLISVEYIPGGYGFHFYPAPISFNVPKNTSVGRVKFVGTSFRVAEKKLLVSYRDCETMETKRLSFPISEREMLTFKRVVCASILSYMRTKKHFGWNFYLSPEIKSKTPFFDD